MLVRLSCRFRCQFLLKMHVITRGKRPLVDVKIDNPVISWPREIVKPSDGRLARIATTPFKKLRALGKAPPDRRRQQSQNSLLVGLTAQPLHEPIGAISNGKGGKAYPRDRAGSGTERGWANLSKSLDRLNRLRSSGLPREQVHPKNEK